eukprot:365300-Chlamydomonas_euryale.AAC.14
MQDGPDERGQLARVKSKQHCLAVLLARALDKSAFTRCGRRVAAGAGFAGAQASCGRGFSAGAGTGHSAKTSYSELLGLGTGHPAQTVHSGVNHRHNTFHPDVHCGVCRKEILRALHAIHFSLVSLIFPSKPGFP